MRRPTRAAAALVVALTTTATFADSPAMAEPAPSGLTAKIISPVPDGSYLSGQQPVTVHVTAEPGVVPSFATVTITSASDQTRSRTGTSPITPTCAPECDITVIVDTVSWIDPGLDPNAGETSLVDGYATIGVTVEGVTEPGTVVQAADWLGQAMQVNNARPQLWPGASDQYTSLPVVGSDLIAIDAFVTPYADGVDRLEVILFGPDVRWSGSFPGAPLDASHQSRITGTIPTSGLTSGRYMLRFVAFDSAGKPSDIITRPVTYYTGPQASVNRLVAQTPTQANGWKGAVAEVTLSVGPDWSPFEPKQVEVYLDGDTTTPAGTVKTFPRAAYCIVTTDGTEDCPATISVQVPLMTPSVVGGVTDWDAPLTPGAHTATAVYTEWTSWHGWPGPSRTATGQTTTTVTAAGVTAATTVKGPVVQNASGTLAFTLTSQAGSGTPAPQIRSWALSPIGAKQIASGTCAGTTCLTVTGVVPLKSLPGSYPGLSPSFHIVPLSLSYTDSDGVTRTTTVNVPVDPAVRTSLSVPTSGIAGATAYATIGVQQLSNEMLPGVPVTLQARTAGATTWRTVASTKTTSTGGVRVLVTLRNDTYWRAVVPARSGWNGAATSPQVYTKVAVKVTASGLPLTGVAGRAYPVRATLYPASTGRRVSVQVRASGTSTWRTVARPATNTYGQISATVKFARGTWQVRIVADATTASASGTSKMLTILVR